jgi:UDP-N-acetylglucosamine diphosphorylase/glucosamine-1-phosphate N-acetyltransferase
MIIQIFEDNEVRKLHPVTLTRSASAINIGSWTLEDIVHIATQEAKTEKPTNILLHCRKHLNALSARQINVRADTLETITPLDSLWINARLWPDVSIINLLVKLIQSPEPYMVLIGDSIALACVPHHLAGSAIPEWQHIPDYLRALDLALGPVENLRMLSYPFHIIEAQKELILNNLEFRLSRGNYVSVKNQKDVWAAEGVEVPALTALRTNDGPIIFDDSVSILDFCFFRGPVYLGPGTKVIEHASVKDGVSTGKTCKIGGEIECAIMNSYSNKQHHGFLGHAFIGSWVNMGAGTSNSDLKNTYGSIQIAHRGERIDTKLQFFGCIMGDYSKTAINTSIFTGKIIGVSSMLYGFVGQNVPSFTNYANSFGQITECDLNQAIRTQARMFARRKIIQEDADVQLLKDVFELTQDERRLSTDPLVL